MAETTETAPQAYLLPAALRQALLSYLMGKPYHEVHDGVQALLALTPLPPPSAE